MVTFERTDPLYILDLSDAQQPLIAGSLEIPGFNELLHPVNDQLLLGFGQEQDKLKLELFNISDISQPRSLAKQYLGNESGAWSEALHNRHAFTYLAGEHIDRISIPTVTNSTQLIDADSPNQFRRQLGKLYQFELRNKHASADAAELAMIGSILADTDADNQDWYPSKQRSVIHQDSVFFLSGGLIWASKWEEEQVNGPF